MQPDRRGSCVSWPAPTSPADLERIENDVDVAVAGAETAWVTPAFIRAWRDRGLGLLGIYAPHDRPALQLLRAGGADETLPDTTPPEQILRAIRSLQRPAPRGLAGGRFIAVTGPRGAPGISEVALSLAWGLAAEHTTLLVDLDRQAPSLAVRLGIDPFPDLATVADRVLASGALPTRALRNVGPLSVLTVPPASGPLTPSLIHEVLRAASHSFDRVVADLGPVAGDDPLLSMAATRVLTCEATPKGLVRAALFAGNWTSGPPVVVLNRATGGDAVAAARKWLGLEPAVVVPETAGVGEASRRGLPPPNRLVELLRPLHDPRVGELR